MSLKVSTYFPAIILILVLLLTYSQYIGSAFSQQNDSNNNSNSSQSILDNKTNAGTENLDNKSKLPDKNLDVQTLNKTMVVYADTISIIEALKESQNEKVNYTYIISDNPDNGTLTGNGPSFEYISDHNFIGTDSFSIGYVDPENNSLLKSVSYTVFVHKSPIYIPLFLASDHNTRAIVALVISFVVTVGIFLIVWWIVKNHKFKGFKTYFSDIIRTSDWDPSLSIFQFLVWTAVIIFSFLALYLVRIFSGVVDFPQGGIPVNVLGLMGISIAVPLISKYITNSKKGPGTLTDSTPPEPRPAISLMLYENNQPSLSRLQLFAWTWISIIIYLSVLFSQINTHMLTTQNLLLPDIDPTLLLLMGLSNFAFLGVKAQNSKMQIVSIFPEEKIDVKSEELQLLNYKIPMPDRGTFSIGKQNVGRMISIFGTNFAHQRDIIWFDDISYPFDDTDIKNDIRWQPTGDRIDLKIPETLEPKLYLVRVANNGFLSEPYVLRVVPK